MNSMRSLHWDGSIRSGSSSAGLGASRAAGGACRCSCRRRLSAPAHRGPRGRGRRSALPASRRSGASRT
eukprot:4725585-Pleurochrysis_carterae.AAC.1